jgi:hypothetical protein
MGRTKLSRNVSAGRGKVGDERTGPGERGIGGRGRSRMKERKSEEWKYRTRSMKIDEDRGRLKNGGEVRDRGHGMSGATRPEIE